MDKLGIDIKLLLSQIVNFLILFFLLSKLLYKPLLKLLEDRKKAIVDMQHNVALAKDDLAKMEEERKKIIAGAKKTADEMVKTGAQEAKDLQKEILEKARETGAKLVRETQEANERLKDKISADIEKRTGSMVVNLTKKMLSEIDEETQHKILSGMIKKLN